MMVETAFRIKDVLKEQGILAKHGNNNNGQSNNNKDKGNNSHWNRNKKKWSIMDLWTPQNLMIKVFGN